MTNQSIETTDSDMPDSCASCKASSFERLDDDLSLICSECGFVVGTEAKIPPPLTEDGSEDTNEADSWSEYYAVTNSTEQQVATAFEYLETLGDDLSLSIETREQVADVYATAALENVTDGRLTLLVVAAAICIGAREAGRPRPSNRVAQAVGIDPGQVKRTIRLFQEELDRGYSGMSPAAYVPFLCEDAGLDQDVERQAIQLAEQFRSETNNKGKHPAGIAGAAIYLASDGTVTQRSIAMVAGVTKETIRVRLEELREVDNG